MSTHKIKKNISVSEGEEEMFITGSGDTNNLTRRHLVNRKKLNKSMTEAEMDSILRYDQKQQEDISETMLKIARTLKNQSQMANSIIREDIKKLEKSKLIADQNADTLAANSAKLETKTKQKWQWGIWLLVIFVFIVFMWMVFLMKVMKKQ